MDHWEKLENVCVFVCVCSCSWVGWVQLLSRCFYSHDVITNNSLLLKLRKNYSEIDSPENISHFRPKKKPFDHACFSKQSSLTVCRLGFTCLPSHHHLLCLIRSNWGLPFLCFSTFLFSLFRNRGWLCESEWEWNSLGKQKAHSSFWA